jgi:L-lactate dehydrogenase complex protein LldE
MKISLFITCLNDTLYPQTGIATVKLLEDLGHQVSFAPEQTCCGQMHLNSGYQVEAIKLIRHWIEVFERELASGCDWIVAPSGSCVAMVREWFAKASHWAGEQALQGRAERIAPKTLELTEFLVNILGTTDVGAYYPARVTYHSSCHGLRTLGLGDQAEQLLKNVRGLELIQLENSEQCCGFGGTFAVKNPETSVAMMSDKIRCVLNTRASVCTGGDNSCLMQLAGGLSRLSTGVTTVHLAEILASREDDGIVLVNRGDHAVS